MTAIGIDIERKIVKGIDLGTSQSGGCYNGGARFFEVQNEFERKGEKKEDNEKGFPSYVQYDEEGTPVLAGVRARMLAYRDQNNTIYDFKRLIGRRYDDPEVQKFKKLLEEKGHYELCEENGEVKIKIGNDKKSPEEVASEIIIEIVKNAFQQDAALKINKIIISVPAYFGLVQRLHTKKAAIIAIEKLKKKYPGKIKIDIENKPPEKIEDIQLISEPTAALITYKEKNGFEGITSDKYIMVFDLGAGTLDITIGKYQVIQSPLGGDEKLLTEKIIHGNNDLGGRKMDERILEWVKSELQKKGIPVDMNIMHALTEAVEKAKIGLSSRESTHINPKDHRIDIPIERKKLEEIIDPDVRQCRIEIKTALEKAKMKKGEIDYIIMVGGPTFMPVIRKAVEEEVGTKIKDIPGWNPMTCVAEGAARSGINPPPPPPTPFGYYFAVHTFNKYLPTMILSQGDKLPVRIEKTLEIPFLLVGDVNDANLFVVEQRSGAGNVIEDFIVNQLSLSLATSQDLKKKNISYSGSLLGECEFPFGYEKVELKGEITKERLMEKPVFNHVKTGQKFYWIDIPFRAGEKIDRKSIIEKAEYEKNVDNLAKEFIKSKEMSIDRDLENNYSEHIEKVVRNNGCSRSEGKRFLFHVLLKLIPPEDFDALRVETAEKIRQAEKTGVPQELIKRWKEQHTKAHTETPENKAQLKTIYKAAGAAVLQSQQ